MRQRTYSTEFGICVSMLLTQTGRSQSDVAKSAGLTPSHFNQFMTGRKVVSPKWCDIISHALHLRDLQRHALHRAAACDAGYYLDLTK